MGVGYAAVIGTSPGIEHTKHSRSARQACGQANLGTATLYLNLMRTRTVNSWRSGHSQPDNRVPDNDVWWAARPSFSQSHCRCLHIFFRQITYSELQLKGRPTETTKYAAILVVEKQIK